MTEQSGLFSNDLKQLLTGGIHLRNLFENKSLRILLFNKKKEKFSEYPCNHITQPLCLKIDSVKLGKFSRYFSPLIIEEKQMPVLDTNPSNKLPTDRDQDILPHRISS